MTLKDYLRIVQRRLGTVVVVTLVAFGIILAYAVLRQRPTYTARARVLIDTPAVVTLISQAPQRLILTPTGLATWQSLVTSRPVLDRAAKRLQADYDARKAAFDPAWLSTVRSVPESGTSIVLLEATAGTPEDAMNVVNAVAEEAGLFGRERANETLEEARRRAGELRDAHRARLEGHERAMADIETQAGTRYVRDDFQKLHEEIRGGEATARDLRRKIAAAEIRLERVGQDRRGAAHLERESIPSGRTTLQQERNPRVQKLVDRLQELHERALAARRKYTPEHPERVRLAEEIRAAELDLTRARGDALGRDLDAEELSLLTGIQIAEIEISVLETSLGKAVGEREVLGRHVEAYDRVEDAARESRKRIDTYDGLLAQLAATETTGYVMVLARATDPGEVTTERTLLSRYWLMGLLLSALMGVGAGYLREVTDTTIRSDYDVRRHLNYPMLGAIPRVGPEELVILKAAEGMVMNEISDTLATMLISNERRPKAILCTSSNPGEGKTTVSANLATALARQGRQVLLVEADIRMPSLQPLLGLSPGAGLSEVLAGTASVDDAGVLQEAPGLPNLRVLLSGGRTQSTYALLDPQRLKPVIEGLRSRFDFLVLDTPPVLRAGDALKIASVSDGVLFIVESGQTDARQAMWSKRLLAGVGAIVLGVVLNKAPVEGHGYYYYYYSSYRYGRSGR